jgi:hypothetical protein
MAWDDTKTPSDSLTASEYNAMVTDQKSRITQSELDTALENRVTETEMNTAIANADVDGGSA